MKFVGVTACPTGIAHTYMAAEKLAEEAKKMSIGIKVETRGSVGIENKLTEQEIREADVVISVSYTHLDVYKRQHTDGVVSKPSIILDGVAIEENGKYVDPELAEICRKMGVAGY